MSDINVKQKITQARGKVLDLLQGALDGREPGSQDLLTRLEQATRIINGCVPYESGGDGSRATPQPEATSKPRFSVNDLVRVQEDLPGAPKGPETVLEVRLPANSGGYIYRLTGDNNPVWWEESVLSLVGEG